MEILTRAKLRKISGKYPQVRKKVEWLANTIEDISPRHLVDVRKTFPSADPVGSDKSKVCFDIKDYRLITDLDYDEQEVLIDEFLTHKAYDKKYPY